jgi:hypothetical protein
VTGDLLTSHQLRSAAWVRVQHDIYADARLDRDHRLACEATSLWLPTGAAIAGPSAAYLYGVEHAAAFDDDVHVIVAPPRRVMSRRGVCVHHTPFEAHEVASIGGTPRTTPLRTAWDVACWRPLVPAVTVIDGLLRLGIVDRDRLMDLAHSRAGRRWARRAARAFDLADGRAQSAPESQLRVRLVLAGLPRPVPKILSRFRKALCCIRTWRGPSIGWPLSTTATGTAQPSNCTGTGVVSTSSSPPAGLYCT